jgi:hypothetical protein
MSKPSSETPAERRRRVATARVVRAAHLQTWPNDAERIALADAVMAYDDADREVRAEKRAAKRAKVTK